VDPDRVIKEVVRDCQTFLEDDALQPSPLSKKRKRIAEGLQNNVLEPSRADLRDPRLAFVNYMTIAASLRASYAD
jgi:hypothetical protein